MRMALLSLLVALCISAAAPASATVLYDNGPLNGNVEAYTVNFGFSVTDSFNLSSASTVTGFTAGFWLFPTDTPVSLQYGISASAFGTDLAFGTATLSNAFQFTNPFGYDVYISTGALTTSVGLAPGNYPVTF